MSKRPPMDVKRLRELEEFNNENSMDLYCDFLFEGETAELIRLARLGLATENKTVGRVSVCKCHDDYVCSACQIHASLTNNS